MCSVETAIQELKKDRKAISDHLSETRRILQETSNAIAEMTSALSIPISGDRRSTQEEIVFFDRRFSKKR